MRTNYEHGRGARQNQGDVRKHGAGEGHTGFGGTLASTSALTAAVVFEEYSNSSGSGLSVPCRSGIPAYKFQIKIKGETYKSHAPACD
jgi:hypothetical protein